MPIKFLPIFGLFAFLLSCGEGNQDQAGSKDPKERNWNPPNDTAGWVARRTDTITDSLLYFEVIYGNLANIHSRDIKLRDKIIRVIDSITLVQGEVPLEVWGPLYDSSYSLNINIQTAWIEIDGLPENSVFDPIRKSATDILSAKLDWHRNAVKRVINDLDEGELAPDRQQHFREFDSTFVQISNKYLEYREIRDSLAIKLNLTRQQTNAMRSKYGKDK